MESDGLLCQQLNLENENLRDIRLINLDLREANLRKTDLRNAVIYADLRGADLSGAKIDNTELIGSNINYMKIENDKLNFIENQLEQEKNWHLPSMKNLKTISKEKEMNIYKAYGYAPYAFSLVSDCLHIGDKVILDGCDSRLLILALNSHGHAVTALHIQRGKRPSPNQGHRLALMQQQHLAGKPGRFMRQLTDAFLVQRMVIGQYIAELLHAYTLLS